MYFVCILLKQKVVGYYDLSVLSMSVMVSKKKFGLVGLRSIQFFFGFLEFV